MLVNEADVVEQVRILFDLVRMEPDKEHRRHLLATVDRTYDREAKAIDARLPHKSGRPHRGLYELSARQAGRAVKITMWPPDKPQPRRHF